MPDFIKRKNRDFGVKVKTMFKIEYTDNAAPKIKINNEYIGLVVKSWFESATSSEQDKVYKLVFPKDCSKNLMLLQSGDMAGLSTTTVLSDKKKFQATAGLKETLEKNEYKLLSFALFGLVEQYLGHISNITHELYEAKQIETKAKFERISHVLESTYEILPELLVDKSLRTSYLNQLVDSNSNCFEMYVVFRERFKSRCDNVGKKVREDNSCYRPANRCFHLKSLLNDNVFAALERFAYGKLCEIFLSNNFTASYLSGIQKQLHSMMGELTEILRSATPWENRFREDWQWNIDNSNTSDRERLQSLLDNYMAEYEDIVNSLRLRLMASAQGVETIIRHSQVTGIQIFIKGGELYIEQ